MKTYLITAPDGTMFDYGGDEEKELSALKKAKQMGLLTQNAEPNQSESDKVTSPLFSEVFRDFLKHKMDTKEAVKEVRSPLSEKLQKDYKRNFNKIINIMDDLPIHLITHKLLRDAVLTCANLPQMNKNPYKNMEISEMLEMEIPEEDRVKGKTIIEIKKTIQGIFAYVVNVAELIEFSPAKDMKLGAKINSSCTFAPYTDEEIRMILAGSSKENKSWRRWLTMLAAYTGCRRSELVQIRKQDVRLV